MSNKSAAWTRAQVEEALAGHLKAVRCAKVERFNAIVTDSRHITQGCIFVALKGEKFDGQDFAVRAVQEGAEALVVSKAVQAECMQFVVDDTLEAYGALAAAWRRRFCPVLIEVAGANGKTSTTQMCAQILAAAFGENHTMATQGNFNNAVGVSRTLLRLGPQHKAAVVEAGISHPGEMAQLVSWIRPTIVVITNAQREHQEFLHGVEVSARENGLALVSLKKREIAVLPVQDSQLSIWLALARARGCRVLTYSTQPGADVVILRKNHEVELQFEGVRESFVLHAAGSHMLHDAAAAAAACLAAGIELKSIAQGLSDFRLLPGRGAQMKLKSGAVLIDDSYNANPDSMKAGIDVLASMPQPQVLIAGDMAETGAHCKQYHEEVGHYAKEKGIARVLCYGEACKDLARSFGNQAQHFDTLQDLTRAALVVARQGGTLLVKASHSSGLQAVVAQLEKDIGISKE